VPLPWQRRLRLAAQVVPPLALAAAALALEAALAAAPGAPGAAVALCTLGVTAVLGAATALLQGGVYALAACLTPVYVQARAHVRLFVVAHPGRSRGGSRGGPARAGRLGGHGRVGLWRERALVRHGLGDAVGRGRGAAHGRRRGAGRCGLLWRLRGAHRSGRRRLLRAGPAAVLAAPCWRGRAPQASSPAAAFMRSAAANRARGRQGGRARMAAAAG